MNITLHPTPALPNFYPLRHPNEPQHIRRTARPIMAVRKPSTKKKAYPQFYRELSNHDITLLASILCHQPSPSVSRAGYQWQSYAAATKRDIEKLPVHLRAHPSMWHKYVNKRISDSLRADLDELCPLHQKLNRPLLFSMMRWVKDEINISIPGMLFPLVQDGLIRDDVKEMFIQLRKVSGMWLSRAQYEDLYGQKVSPQWVEQHDRCPACILSRLSGDKATLVALRAGMLARSRSIKIKESKRMAYVEALIAQGFEEEESVKMMEDAMWVGAEVKTIWKQRKAGKGKKLDEVLKEDIELLPTPLPLEKPLPADPYFPLQDIETTPASKSSPHVETSLGYPNEVDSDDGSVYSEQEDEEDAGDIYDEINDIIKEYEYMMSRQTLLSPRHYHERRGEAPSQVPQPQRAADSRAISYMQDMRANPFKSGVQSFGSRNTTWSLFAGPKKPGRDGWI